MEHQDTKLTSMRPRLKELNDTPYIKGDRIDSTDGLPDVAHKLFMRIPANCIASLLSPRITYRQLSLFG